MIKKHVEIYLENIENKPTSYKGGWKKIMMVIMATKQQQYEIMEIYLENESDVSQAATIVPIITLTLLTFGIYLSNLLFFSFLFYFIFSF